jgi:hypothetical protein
VLANLADVVPVVPQEDEDDDEDVGAGDGIHPRDSQNCAEHKT